MALHRIHFGAEQRKQRRNVAGASSDFEYAVGILKREVREHRGHDVRLRDSLSFADGQRVIFVGLLLQSRRDKLMPRNSAHSVKNARITNAALCKLRADHSFAL